MRTRSTLLRRLAVAISAASLLAFAPLAAAQASPAGHAHAASASGQVPYTQSGGGSEVTGSPIAAPNGCVTIHTYEWIADSIGIHLAQFNMYTYWCWNHTIVTSHSTSETGTVTTTGSIGGWQYDGLKSTAFNCFYYNSYKCSGNHETAQGSFQACQYNVCYSNWYPILQQWEDSQPNWWASYS